MKTFIFLYRHVTDSREEVMEIHHRAPSWQDALESAIQMVPPNYKLSLITDTH